MLCKKSWVLKTAGINTLQTQCVIFINTLIPGRRSEDLQLDFEITFQTPEIPALSQTKFTLQQYCQGPFINNENCLNILEQEKIKSVPKPLTEDRDFQTDRGIYHFDSKLRQLTSFVNTKGAIFTYVLVLKKKIYIFY